MLLPAKLFLVHALDLLLPEHLLLLLTRHTLLTLHVQLLLLLPAPLLLHLLEELLLCLLLLLKEGIVYNRGNNGRRGLRWPDLGIDGHGDTKHIPCSSVSVLNLSTNMPVEHVELIDQARMNVRERGVVSGECVSRRPGSCARRRHVAVATLRRAAVRHGATRRRDLRRQSSGLAAENRELVLFVLGT